MRVDVPLCMLGAMVVAGVIAAIVEPPAERVARAQAEFEASPAGRGYNWPVFHQANSIAKLKCRDITAALRVCDVTIPTINPATGESDGWSHTPFACNTTTCGWLSE